MPQINMTLWINSPDSVLLIAVSLLIWSATTYAIMPDPMSDERRAGRMWFLCVFLRAFAGSLFVGTVAGWRDGWSLALVMFVFVISLPISRHLLVPAKYAAELELSVNALLVGVVTAVVSSFHLHSSHELTLPFTSVHIAAMTSILAVLFFTIRGGTYIVRGILKKAGTLPQSEGSSGIDVVEVNRGRLIGNIERIILIAVIAAGSYEALGFLVAAKGLIRAKELEQREWAEYFLVGSLASVLVALLGGILIQRVVAYSWK